MISTTRAQATEISHFKIIFTPVVGKIASLLSATHKKVDLSGTDFSDIKKDDCTQVYAQLNPALKKLALIGIFDSCDFMGGTKFGDPDIPAIISEIPKTIEDLDFRCNNLNTFAWISELEWLFLSISEKNIRSLNLCGNHIDKISDEFIEGLEGALPKIENLYLSSKEIEDMTFKQLDAFAKIVPCAINVIALNRHDEETRETKKLKYLRAKTNALKNTIIGLCDNMPLSQDIINYTLPFFLPPKAVLFGNKMVAEAIFSKPALPK